MIWCLTVLSTEFIEYIMKNNTYRDLQAKMALTKMEEGMKLGEKITGQLLEGGTLDKFLDLKLVNDRSWLAGGALRSLVDPKEKISDYDMFFRSRRVCDDCEA